MAAGQSASRRARQSAPAALCTLRNTCLSAGVWTLALRRVAAGQAVCVLREGLRTATGGRCTAHGFVQAAKDSSCGALVMCKAASSNASLAAHFTLMLTLMLTLTLTRTARSSRLTT